MATEQGTPSYSISDSKTTQILSVLIITTTLALLSFVLRMYVRLRIVKKLWWDDYTMIAAIAFATVALVFESMAVRNGIGTHKKFLDPARAIEASKWASLTITPNVLTTVMARISLCLLMLRIVGRTKMYRWFLVGVIIGTCLVGTLTVINTYITCQPVPKLWNASLKGVCHPRQRYILGMIQSVWTISADWLVALFPLLLLKKLQMALKTKVALGIIMSLGFLIGIIVLLKTLKVGSLFSRTDATYDGADLATWSIVEQNVGVIIVNVPAIRPLFSHIFALTKKSSKGTSDYMARGYRLDDFNTNRSHAFQSGVVSMARKGQEDPDLSGSESSLVGKNIDGLGITKTVGVSVRSYRPGNEKHAVDRLSHSDLV